MKHLAQAAAFMMFLAMCSGVAVADDHMQEELAPKSGVDSANDPDELTENGPEMQPEGELAPKSGVDSANDPDELMENEPGMQPEGELAPKSGVDSANDPDDVLEEEAEM